ncbi:MAG: ArsR family transcriptional regulator [Euryarchaeota archaeon]|jgi:DNA-binding MarR family transcriptional regulator|nr:ArsR family transcriptional regulator [Euryarchaeota archaeon]MBT3653755.1 ArsR family transcriptional regulator [Euryarchaeota archaeon]MBT3757770.1 ArsR family transcriptional regulator [Euryarchaeota archaeon]MBT4051156.1 ArsR family transcriptional regulator [Euryarchaeota archaeon]MBT4649938.1 ArsR family transcriptional regulator [Euryarchaeota archaeon]
MGVPFCRESGSLRAGVIFCSTILLISLVGSISVVADSSQITIEVTWVNTAPGEWMLKDSSGDLYAISPVPGLSLHPATDRVVEVSYSDTGNYWIIFSEEIIIPAGQLPITPVDNDNSLSGEQSETPLSLPFTKVLTDYNFTGPLVAIIGAILMTFALAYAADEPTRKRVTEAVGRFGELRIHEGQGTLAGNYQRGRIIGFLTAHPGCHLSALIRTLDLGNHQAVHHLRILEQSGSVWCRRDGRLLRYYTDKVNQSAELSNLPRPIDIHQLSDVSLMLLREIALQLPEVKSPSQRELAAKLETSQQLISHHLRRLENQGLIARKRSGLRTRRVLTEEGQRIWAKLAIPA